jgi:hypothetical protein
MMANSAADGWEWVALLYDTIGFLKLAFFDEGHVARHILAYGTGMLAWCPEQAGANRGWAFPVNDVCLVFLAEMPDGAEYRVGRSLPQAAKRRGADHLGQFLKEVNVFQGTLASGDPAQYVQHLGDSCAARHALATGLVLGEFQEEFRHIDHAAVFIHHDESAGAHNGP